MVNRQKNWLIVPPLRRLAAGVVLTYMILIVLFYFLSGEQLHLRKSRGDINFPLAESGTVELCQGTVVEQQFKIGRASCRERVYVLV